MKLHWYGHSCFLLTNRQGSRLLLDPFNDKVGYPMPMFAADVVLTSHGHFDHANVDAVEGPFTRYAEPGRYEDHGFVITGFPTFHDNQKGAIRGSNTAFLVEADGCRILHLGDLGHVLSQSTVSAIGRVDILLLPVGGGYTIDAGTAETVRRQLSPVCTVPMHYRTTVCLLTAIGGLEPYLEQVPTDMVRYLGADVDQVDLLGTPGIAIMKYAQ